MQTKIEDGKLIITIDLTKGASPSASGKMDLFDDVPRGWNRLGEHNGRPIHGSLNIGYK